MTGCFACFDRTGDLNRAGEQQQLLGECGFTGVGVRNDGKRASSTHFF
jgi:hypothetical protein